MYLKRESMKNLFLTTIAAIAFAGAAYAADVGGEVSVDVTENVAGNFVATPGVDLSFGVKGDAATVFAGVDVTVDNSNLVLDGWHIGTAFGATSVSFGDQGDLFSFGGLEVVGGETLAGVADDHESVIVKHGKLGVLVGFTDITSDIGDIENVQLAYAGEAGSVSYNTTVDYNLDTEDFVVGAAATTIIASVDAGLAVTYADAFAYEVTAGYKAATVFVNGDEANALQNIGLGVKHNYNGADLYAEVGYNVDTKESTPAIGVSFAF
jgi:hypothetical protein